MAETPATETPATPPSKPAILRSSEFTVEEGLAYRAFRTGAIWMNKLFFSSLVLLVVWVAYAATTGETWCTSSYTVADGGDVPAQRCSVFLTPTAKFLGAMAVLSFLLSLAFGALGLVVGKRILEMTPSQQEVGAGAARKEEHGQPGEVPGRGP